MAQVPYSPVPTVENSGPATARQNIDGASPDAFGAGVGRQMSQLGNVISGAFDPWAQQEQQAKKFDAEKVWQETQNEVDTHIFKSAAELTGDGVGYTDGNIKFARDLTAQKFKAAGWNEIPPEYQVKLENSIGGWTARSAKFELDKRVQNQTNTIDSNAAGQLIAVMKDPSNNTRAEFEKRTFELIDKSNLPAGEKEALKQKYTQQYSYYQGLGLSEQKPQEVLSTVTGEVRGQGPYGKINVTYDGPIDKSSPGAPSPLEFYKHLKAGGATDQEAILLTSAAASESGFNRFAKHDGGIGFGLFGHNGARLKMMYDRYGANPSWQDQATFALNELRTRPEGQKVNQAKTVEELTDAQMAFEAPQGYSPGSPKTGHNYTGRFNNTARFAKELGGMNIPTGATVNPVIASLPAEQQLQLAGQAERNLNKQDVQRAALEQANRARFQDVLQHDVSVGLAGKPEIEMAFQQQLISGEQFVNYNNLADRWIKEKQVGQSVANDIAEGRPFNPFDKEKADGVNSLSSTFRQQQGVTEAQAQQYDGWLYGKTGILPSAAEYALKANLFGGNPQNVAFGMQQALGYLNIARSLGRPDAFAGMSQKEEIEKAAVSFEHYTNDLGMSPEAAANKWLQQQTPEHKARMTAMQEEVKAFKEELRQTDYTSQILAAVAPTGYFSKTPDISPKQSDEMNKTFNELMVDRFQETGSRDEARAWALKKMGDMYGEANGVVMKWPITKYPALPDTGHQYIFDQAKETVKNFTGREPTNVYFLPVTQGGTPTREDYQAGRPPAYQLYYSYKDPSTSQEFFDLVTGPNGAQAGWRPDPMKAVNDYRQKQEAAGAAARAAVDEAYVQDAKRFEAKPLTPDLMPDKTVQPPPPEPPKVPKEPTLMQQLAKPPAPPRRAGTVFRGMRVPE